MRLGAKIGISFEIDWEKRQRNLKNDYFCADFDKTNQSNRATDMMQYQVFGDVLFYMLYGGVAVAAIIACCFYMIISVKRYGKWLRDNYADLENKEIWQSIGFMFILFIYWFDDGNKTIGYLIQGTKIILIALLLWRVETLQQLDAVATEEADTTETPAEPEIATMALPSGIGQLLERHCEDAQLYLQHDLTLSQLSHTIGTNHYYLSQHFTQQGLTYNAYINGLRIRHFIKLYHEAVATQRPFTAQQLANESGFRSYSTFSAAFKQRMGQTVTAWMRDTEKAQNNLLLRVTFSKSAKKAFQNLQFLWILQKSSWNVQNILFEFFEAIRMQENGLFLRNCRNNNCRNNI